MTEAQAAELIHLARVAGCCVSLGALFVFFEICRRWFRLLDGKDS